MNSPITINNNSINKLLSTYNTKIKNSKSNFFKLISFMNFLEKKFSSIKKSASNYKKEILNIVCNHKENLFSNNNITYKNTLNTIFKEVFSKLLSSTSQNNKSSSTIQNNNKMIGIVLGEGKGKNNHGKTVKQKIILICKNDLNHINNTINFLLNNISISTTGYCASISSTKINLGDHFCLTVPKDDNEIIIRLPSSNYIENKSVFEIEKLNNGKKYRVIDGKIQKGGVFGFILGLIIIIGLFFIAKAVFTFQSNHDD